MGEAEAVSELTQRTEPSGEINQSSAPAAGETADPQARDKAFRALMDGEYKDLFTAYFQETFNRRFREQKEMQAELEGHRTMIREMAACCGVTEQELLPTIRAEYEKKNAPTDIVVQEGASAAAEADALQAAVETAVASACAEAEHRIVAAIRARGLRPAEGALGEGCGAALRAQAGSLSRAQRAELARRAAGGEQIKF